MQTRAIFPINMKIYKISIYIAYIHVYVYIINAKKRFTFNRKVISENAVIVTELSEQFRTANFAGKCQKMS